MNNLFSYYVTKFFTEYLPKVKRLSKNTILSYNDTILIFLKYMKTYKEINFNTIKIEDITINLIESFIVYLKDERKLSATSSNQRLAAIKSLFKYIQIKDASSFDLCNKILKIPFAKTPKPIIDYLSIEEVEYLMNSFNLNSSLEVKHFMIISLLFETGARVQELCDLKNSDINFERNSITLHGKGNKTRDIPLSENLKNNLQQYIKSKDTKENDQLLFNNKYNQKLTRAGISYIINKYIERCHKEKEEWFNIKVTPHTFRHSKAISMLEAGISIFIIRDFLGHVSIATTERYLKVSIKFKERELSKNANDIAYELKEQEIVTEKDLIDVLKSLK